MRNFKVIIYRFNENVFHKRVYTKNKCDMSSSIYFLHIFRPGTPAEVALIRMTADGRLPPNERRNYKHVVDALFRIYKEEGLATLWRGAIPTMGRAMVVNAAQLASYSQAKQILVENINLSEGIFLHFVASMISGLITTAASMPVDIAKTRQVNWLFFLAHLLPLSKICAYH